MRTHTETLDHHRHQLHTWCEVCRTFATDPGRCLSCDPSPTGDLVGDLIALRRETGAPPVTDDRLHAAGLLSADEA